MDLLCVFLVWILAVVPSLANSCISRSAVCCMVGEVEGKIFFDEIEGPGCSNRGKVQVILNLIGLRSQEYNNNDFYHFRLKTYGEILPACSGVGGDYGFNSGHIATLQSYEDGSVYNDTIFLPGASSGYGTDALIGRSVAVYAGRPSRRPNQRPLACCVIGRGQPVTLPLPSPAQPTPLGPNKPIDLSVGQQTKDPSTFTPDTINQNGGTGNRKPDITIGSNNQNGNGFYPNKFPTNNNNALSNGPNKPIAFPGNNNDNNVNNNINNPNNKNTDAGNKKNPKYTFDEDGIDRKFNLIGGYGDASNFEFDTYQPRNERTSGMGNTNNNNNGDNVYNQGNNNYNLNTAGVFGPPNNNPQLNGNSQNRLPSNNGGRGGFTPNNNNNNNNNNFNSFNGGNPNRGRGFGNSQFPSVFGSIGSGNFFNLDGKLAGANLINGDPRSTKGFGQSGDGGVLGTSLGKGFEPPKGPSFQDIYNKPTGESPLSNGGGFSDAVSPDEENSISRLFFADSQIKDTIGLSDDDKFIPRESEDEEESTSYRSQSDSDDEEPESDSGGPGFDTDANNLSAIDGEYTDSDDNDNGSLDLSPPSDDQISSNDPIEISSGSDSVVDIRPSN